MYRLMILEECLLFHVLHKCLLMLTLIIIVYYDTGPLISKHVALQCTGLTCVAIIYPHIDALKISSGIRYLTAEDSCCGSLRVTVEKNCSNPSRIKYTSITPSSVVW